MAKYGMSMCVLGMAEELRPQGIAVNALWPKTGVRKCVHACARACVCQLGAQTFSSLSACFSTANVRHLLLPLPQWHPLHPVYQGPHKHLGDMG